MAKFETSSLIKTGFLLTALVFGSGSASLAEDKANSLKFELGAGGLVKPTYEGAASYGISPSPMFRFLSLETAKRSIGGGDSRGFSIGPSFDFVGKRGPSDDPSLAGIPTVKGSLELGVAAAYESEYFRIFAKARYGVTGHNGIVGETGIEAVYQASENFRITLGPFITAASTNYMDAYFSVPTSATALAPYTAGAGLKSVGVKLDARHELSDKWAVQGILQYSRLIADVGSSPIVAAGSKNQYAGKLTLIRKISIDF
jgi:outer membrane protein